MPGYERVQIEIITKSKYDHEYSILYLFNFLVYTEVRV